MPEIVEVAFKSGCKVYSFDPAGMSLNVGEQVIVRTSRGMEMGKVVVANHEVPQEEIVAPLEKVVRRASETDLATIERNDKLAARVSQVCEEKIEEYGLDMRLINTEVVFDGSKIIISFFAEERVDFRKLVEDLAKKYRTRIEFRQVGVRDEARLIGGYGPCGRRMCCTLFAGDQQPVSIKMAKEQNLPLNPMKISGICGRLMCCLKYEQEAYKDFKCRCPGKGTLVMTDKGEGRVSDFLVPKEKVLVNLGEAGQVEASLEELEEAAARPRDQVAAQPADLEKTLVSAGSEGSRQSGRGEGSRRGRGRSGRRPGRGGRGGEKVEARAGGEGGQSKERTSPGGMGEAAAKASASSSAEGGGESGTGKSGENSGQKSGRRGRRGGRRRRRR